MSVSIWTGHSTDHDLNLSNHNFVRLMDLLGVDTGDGHSLCGKWEDEQFCDVYARATTALRTIRHFNQEHELIWPPLLSGGVVQTDMQNPAYVANRLSALIAVFEEAIQDGRGVHFG